MGRGCISHTDDLNRLYLLLDSLRERTGGYRYLKDCTARSGWPDRGVYFFFEEGEMRSDGRSPRVVRVGTHAIDRRMGDTTLWRRVNEHKGTTHDLWAGGGHHRLSVFRRHVGSALLNRKHQGYPELVVQTWGLGLTANMAAQRIGCAGGGREVRGAGSPVLLTHTGAA